MLVGRDTEMQALRAVVDRARDGHGSAIVVHGEAGVGKSSLLGALQAEAGDIRVLRTSGIEAESPLAFGALHRMLLPLLDRLDRLPAPQARAIAAVLGRADAAEGGDRFVVFLAALGLVSDAAEESPVLCVVDDAQWLDDASQAALLFIARRIELAPVAMVFAAREGDDRRFDPGDLARLAVEPLAADAAEALLAHHAGLGRELAPDVRNDLVRRVGGNPLALVEIARALTPGEATGSTPLPRHLPLTADLERLFAEQVNRLGSEAVNVLLIAALEDSGTSAVVARAAARSGVDGDRGMVAAERAGLLRTDGATFEFRHPLLRSAVVSTATAAERRSAHAALAEVLTATKPDRAVWHRAAASEPPDEQTAAALDRSAERARRVGGHEAASAASERAAELSADPESRTTRLGQAAASAWAAGDPTRTRELAEQVRGSTDAPGPVGEAERLLAFLEMNFGSPRLAHRILVGASSTAQREGDLGTARRFAMVAAALASFDADSGERPDVGALVGATGSSNPADACLSALLAALDHLTRRRETEAMAELRRGMALAESLDVPDLVTNIGIATLQVGDDDAALRWHDRQLDDARRSAAVLQTIHALTRRGVAQITTGAWGELRVAATEAIDLARATGHPNQRPLPLAQLLVVDAYQARDDIGERADAIEAHARRHPAGVVDVLTFDLVAWARGIDQARDAPATTLAHLGGIRLALVQRAAAIDVVDAAARAGRDDVVAATAAELGRFATATGSAWAAGDAAYARALQAESSADAGAEAGAGRGSGADDDGGRPDAAADREHHLAEAVHRHAEGTRPLDRARSELAYGEFLRRARRRVDAREHLRAAIAEFERLGATPFADRAAEELRASGETARRRIEADDASALTAQELQVARLVRQGLSNREVAARLFVSPRTVEFHLRNVFAKLGISTRGGLAPLELDAPA